MVGLIKTSSSSASFFSKPEKSPDEASEEASLRSALERMGSSHHNYSQSMQRSQGDTTQAKRRRFVRDGDVPVERHSLPVNRVKSLPAVKVSGTARTVHFSDHGEGELSKLRALLALEKQRADDAERRLEEMQHVNKTLETRQVHTTLEVTELKARVEGADSKISDQVRTIRGLQWDLERCEEEKLTLRKRLEAKPRGRPRKVELSSEVKKSVVSNKKQHDITDDEPQPVKWWKD